MARLKVALASLPGQAAPDHRPGDVSALLTRIRAQADDLVGQLESAPLPPKDQAAVLATLARIAPQLAAAEREASKAIAGRELSTLSNAELANLIDRMRANRT